MSEQYVGMEVDKQKIVLARLNAARETRSVEKVIANTPSPAKAEGVDEPRRKLQDANPAEGGSPRLPTLGSLSLPIQTGRTPWQNAPIYGAPNAEFSCRAESSTRKRTPAMTFRRARRPLTQSTATRC